MGRQSTLLLAGALLIGLLVRLPGVWWGANFPSGWYGHHPDEYTHVLYTQRLINPDQPRYDPERSAGIGLKDPWSAGFAMPPYPKGLATHVAVPMIAARALSGEGNEPPPPSAGTIPPGRVVTVLYGTATILLVFLLARRLFTRPAVSILSAWLLALGGLHVTQSHFFVADIPALFWLLLGMLLLWQDLDSRTDTRSSFLAGAAFCFGVAFGIKLLVAALPSLGLAVIMRRGWLPRALLAAVFFLLGMLLINLASYTPIDFYRTVRSGISDPWIFSRSISALLYLAEMPSITGLPLFLASFTGALALFWRTLRLSDRNAKQRIAVVILLPLIVHLVLVLFRLDHFPRHLVAFIPWLAMAGAWMTVRTADMIAARSRIPWMLLPVTVLAWQALFVFDGEKGFINDPRNQAAEWISNHAPSGSTMWWYYHGLPNYKMVAFPKTRPDVIVEEMHHANHYLSGMGLRNSMPRDYRNIFDTESQEEVDAFQALFSGESEYREIIRFSENYFMPEFTVTYRYLGNRSLNYLAEVVIFMKDTISPDR